MKKNRTIAIAKDAPSTLKANTLKLETPKQKTNERVIAECGLSPILTNSSTSRMFSHGTFGVLEITEVVAVMREKVDKVQSGDLSDVEATLTAQAATLDTIFNELARRGSLNMGEYINAAETYLRLALKAQSQCRTTLETLAEIKNPRPVAFVKQANIAHGPQQVNNGIPVPHARENKNQQDKQSGESNELLPDTRASQVESRINPQMETVGKIDRAENS